MRIRESIFLVLSFAVFSGGLLAQDEPKVEIIPYLGYTLSEGVDIQATDIPGDRTVNGLDPTSALSYGFEADLLLGENFYLGFNFSNQDSELQGKIQGEGKLKLTDMSVQNYHGIFGYNVGDSDESMRPYFFGGLGATHYNPDDIEGYSVDGSTRFSTTWGGGVKFYFSENVGARLGARWTPTYINSEASGIWCSPWIGGGCWVLGSPNYSNQFEMSAGLALRF
jgi:opacity protein-like surface antigen